MRAIRVTSRGRGYLMKKRVIVLIAISMMLVIASCGKKEENNTVTEPKVAPTVETTTEPIATEVPSEEPEITEAPIETEEPVIEATVEATIEPKETEVPKETSEPIPEPTKAPVETPKATEVPKATEAPKKTEEPKTTEAPKSETPKATEAPKVTEAPKTETPKETEPPKTVETPSTTDTGCTHFDENKHWLMYFTVNEMVPVEGEPACHYRHIIKKQCSRCGVEEVTDKPYYDHKGVTDIYILPTCEEEGRDKATCSICGEVVDDITLAPLGHEDTNGPEKIFIEGIYDENGEGIGDRFLYKYECSRCGLALGEEIVDVMD